MIKIQPFEQINVNIISKNMKNLKQLKCIGNSELLQKILLNRSWLLTKNFTLEFLNNQQLNNKYFFDTMGQRIGT